MNQVDTEDRLEKIIISPQISISEAIAVLDRAGLGVLALCEDDRRLVGVLTDGDIRRAILLRVSFDEPCISIASRDPVVAPPQVSGSEALHLMDHGKPFIVDHLPVVDADGRVVDLVLRSDLVTQDPLAGSAVIMAGGLGTRLRPLTEEMPKPMLPVGGRPIMEWTIKGLQQAGIRRIAVTTHYKADVITEHFGDGHNLGVEIEYVHEDRLSGTAGALELLRPWHQPLLVINGDILTRADFGAMLQYHKECRAHMTVAVREYRLQVPYGIVEMQEDVRIRALTEKPLLRFFVNAGIYLLEPLVQSYTTKGEFLDMTDLIAHLLDDSRSVVGFPVREYWIDIGQIADYERAEMELEETATE